MAILRTAAAAAAAAKQLSQVLLSAADARHLWTPSHEQAAHRFLCRHHCRPCPDGSSGRPLLTPPLVAATIDPHLLPHPPLALGLFHWASQQPGFAHTTQTYQSLLRSLSLSRRPTSLVNALSRARAEGVPLPPSSVFLAAKSLLLCGRTLEAFGVVEQIAKSGSSSCDGSAPEVYNSLLAACSDDGRWDLARRLFEEMTRSGLSFNGVGFGVFINGICGSVGLDETLRLVERMAAQAGKVDGSVVAALVADGLSRAGRIEEAWRAVEELRSRGGCCKPDFIAYRIVAEAFKKAGRVDDAWRILKQKRKFGVAPRADCYKEYILLLISERRVTTAKRLGEAIVDGSFPVDGDVLNALVGSVAAVDSTSAASLCTYMIGKGMLPTHLTLSNLSRNLCGGDAVWEIFRVLLSKDYFRDVGSYNLVVSFLCRAGRVREAYDVLGEMRKKGFPPDVASYNALMEACCREDLLRPAKKLWDEMFASGCPGNLRTYNTLITKFSETTGAAEEALGLFHHMVGKGVAPDETTYTSLIKVLCRANRTDDACEVFYRSLEQRDPKLGSSVLGTLVLRLCGDCNFPAATRLLICGLPPGIVVDDTSSHVVLLKGLADAGHVDEAVGHAEWIRDNIPSKLGRILDELVASLPTAPKLQVFLQLLQEMCQRGLLSKEDAGPWCLGGEDLCSNSGRCLGS